MNKYSEEELLAIAGSFRISGKIISIIPYGNGHINDTFKVDTDFPETYILQRINQNVFKNIDGLMRNMALVLDHLKQKPGKMIWPELIEFNGERRLANGSPGLPTADCGLPTADWRMITFIRDSRSFETVRDPKMALEAGKALGYFQKCLSDLPAEQLVETIPSFHLLTPRLRTFEDAVRDDVAERVQDACSEIQAVRELSGEMLLMDQLLREKRLPIRITHNDTKINNILFNGKGEAISLIDLDTVMPGTALYDFGDAIRTGANAAQEDEPDLQKVIFRKDIFEGYLEGYLSEASEFLAPLEKDLLPFSARYMTYLIGLRFLTDYLMGDVYYKTAYPEHNLVRARVQFTLLKKLEVER